MIKNFFIFLTWQIIGIIVSHMLISRSTSKLYVLFVILLQTLISLIVFEYGSRYVQLGYFSSITLLLPEILKKNFF